MNAGSVQIDYTPTWYKDYKPHPGLYQMIAPCRTRWEYHGRAWDIMDPATNAIPGMVCDLFSIPKPVRWLWPRNRGYGNIAARVHDFTRRFHTILGMSVLESDILFLAIMRTYDIREAGLFYSAVRAGAYMGATARGDGLPPRDVRRAMEANGDDWRAFAVRVSNANPDPVRAV